MEIDELFKEYGKVITLANCVKAENTPEFMEYWNRELAKHRGKWLRWSNKLNPSPLVDAHSPQGVGASAEDGLQDSIVCPTCTNRLLTCNRPVPIPHSCWECTDKCYPCKNCQGTGRIPKPSDTEQVTIGRGVV